MTCICCAMARWPAASSSDRWLGTAGAGAALREPLAHQIQADHRRFRRLGAVSETAAGIAAASPIGMASTSPRWRAAPCWTARKSRAVIVGARNRSHLAANLAIIELQLTAADHGRDRRGPASTAGSGRRHIHAGARPRRAAWLDHEIQSEQAGLMTTLADAAAREVVGAPCRVRGAVYRPVARFQPGARRRLPPDFRDGDAARHVPRARRRSWPAFGQPIRARAISASTSTISGRSGSRANAVLLQYVEQQYRDGETTRRLSTALFEAPPKRHAASSGGTCTKPGCRMPKHKQGRRPRRGLGSETMKTSCIGRGRAWRLRWPRPARAWRRIATSPSAW